MGNQYVEKWKQEQQEQREQQEQGQAELSPEEQMERSAAKFRIKGQAPTPAPVFGGVYEGQAKDPEPLEACKWQLPADDYIVNPSGPILIHQRLEDCTNIGFNLDRLNPDTTFTFEAGGKARSMVTLAELIEWVNSDPQPKVTGEPNPHPRVDALSLPVIYRTIAEEAERGRDLHGDYRSTHEGLGVLMEEVAELVEDIRKNNMPGVFFEAVQVAAVAVKLAEFAFQQCQAEKGGQANG